MSADKLTTTAEAKRVTELRTQINRLQNEKNQIAEELNNRHKIELDAKATEITKLKSDKTAIQNSLNTANGTIQTLQKQFNTQKTLAEQLKLKNEELQAQLNSNQSTASSQTAELQKLKKENVELQDNLRDAKRDREQFERMSKTREQENKDLQTQLGTARKQIESLQLSQKADADGIRSLLVEEQGKRITLENKLNTLNQRVNGRYTAEDLAAAFRSTIDSFNTQMTGENQSFSYIINSMDVDLKAQIVKNQSQQVEFLTDPSSSSDNAYSTLKITIRAVPK